MRFDLFTLYFLAVGTLLLSAGLTLWERQARAARRRELGVLAAGYATLALGCLFATVRTAVPGILGSTLCNLAMLAGYMMVLDGVAGLRDRDHRRLSLFVWAMVGAAWMIAGTRWETAMWAYGSALPIAAVCGLMAWEMQRNACFRDMRSRSVVVAIASFHAVFYAGRALVLPLAAAWFGDDVIDTIARLTMYEGVLFSVGLPMALLALMRDEAQAKLLAASQTDYLTGLGNRRWFFHEGERIVRTHGVPVTLLAFDLDHFKSINDAFGHDVGDAVLRLFARVAREQSGPDAILARLGGEEFVVLLPGTAGGEALKRAQAVIARFAVSVSDQHRGPGVKATVSAGLAELGADGDTLDKLMRAADQALYRAKAQGRNRVELARPIVLPAAC